MVYIIVCLIFFNLISCTKKKSFECQIIYTNSFTALNKNITKEYLKERYGDTVVISIKGAYYKHEYNSKNKDGIKSLTYDPQTNKAYIENNITDTLLWYYCHSTPRELFNVKEDTSTITILGHKCNKITFESAFQRDNLNYNISTSFFYNKDHYIDPSLYEDHGEGFLNMYFNKSESMYLKYIYTEHETFERRQIAIKIIPKEIDINEFNIDTAMARPIF